MTRRGLLRTGLGLGIGAGLGLAGAPAPAIAHHASRRPTTLHLPNGFHPAAIGIGNRSQAYFGSLLGGAVYRVDLASGNGELINDGDGEGYLAVGIGVDSRERLFVAGGWQQSITVMDGGTGRVLRTYSTGSGDAFIDHVVVTPRAVWFTDALNARLVGLPLGPRGELPAQREIVELRLGGQWVQGPADGISATGIAATPDGRGLLVVNIHAYGGRLYRVDPRTGHAELSALGSLRLPTTNGIATHGRTLFAPGASDLAVVDLSADGRRGRLRRTIEDPRFDVPSAAAVHKDRLYLPNSRFGTEPAPDLPYTAVAIPLPR